MLLLKLYIMDYRFLKSFNNSVKLLFSLKVNNLTKFPTFTKWYINYLVLYILI